MLTAKCSHKGAAFCDVQMPRQSSGDQALGCWLLRLMPRSSTGDGVATMASSPET